MNVIFSVAATFLALKAGQGIETAIPISILAVGLSGFLVKAGMRASSILENVYALSISTTSGYVAGGTCFTMPAIYILKLNAPDKLDMNNVALFLQIALVPLLGAILGALFLIPFRRYFVKEMHGKLPFPEATATNEILVTGASGSTSQAWILIYSFILSAVYTFLGAGLRVFSHVFTTGEAAIKPIKEKGAEVLAFGDIPLFETLTHKIKAVIAMGTGAYYLGLGFIIGLRYASIICAGSFLSALAITPMLASLDFDQLQQVNPGFKSTKGLTEEEPRFVLPAGQRELINALVVACTVPTDETEEAAAAREEGKKALFARLGEQINANEYRTHEIEKAKLTEVTEGAEWKFTDARRGWVIRATEAGLAFHALEPNAHDVWLQAPRIVGIGAIFTAGLLSILKMGKVIVTALRQALGGLISGKGGGTAADKTDEDVSYPIMMLLGLAVVVVMTLFFRFVVFDYDVIENKWWLTFVSVVLALVIAFLFTTVSAWAIAMISVTPISGMTVTTIIITAVLMVAAGLPKGDEAMLAVLLVGGVVCTALSMAGGLITNFKMAYWLGASPKRITWNAIIGSAVSAVFVCGTIMILDINPGYTGENQLPAPQANMMAGALESFLGSGDVPWLLYGIGVVIALTVELIGISALAFGLGMYLPMEINTPILVGALVATLVKKSTKDGVLSKARSNKGILIASGLIAGGAIMEVLISFTGAIDDMAFDTVIMPFFDLSGHLIAGGTDPAWLARFENWLGLILFVGLCVFVYLDCRRAKAELGESEIG
jgi:uncharacterized oligopeptide transporter (OPT) family protein